MFRLVAPVLRRHATVGSARLFHQATRATQPTSRRFATALGLGSLVLAAVGATTRVVELDNKVQNEDSVHVDSAIDPFPRVLSPETQSNIKDAYQLLGYGVRSVTFIGFKVYGIAIYTATKDSAKIKTILGQYEQTEKKPIKELLNDSEKSVEIIEKLIDNDVQFLIRILPVRNTDFGHLRDGFIKSILASKLIQNSKEVVNQGLEELRGVFLGFKGSVPKNHLLWLEYNKTLALSYENTKLHQVKPMGVVNNATVGKILVLAYLSGNKSLSEPLRKSSVDGFAGI